MTNPAASPSTICVHPARGGAPATRSCASSSAAAITTSSTAITRYSVSDLRRVAHPAPNQAPARLPPSRFTMIGQCDPISEKGTVLARNDSAVATTTRLVALFRMTASSPRKRNRLMSRGSRNSAPPRPIKPPSVPMRVPDPNATGSRTRPKASIFSDMFAPRRAGDRAPGMKPARDPSWRLAARSCLRQGVGLCCYRSCLFLSAPAFLPLKVAFLPLDVGYQG
jgi:hypothetical protein